MFAVRKTFFKAYFFKKIENSGSSGSGKKKDEGVVQSALTICLGRIILPSMVVGTGFTFVMLCSIKAASLIFTTIDAHCARRGLVQMACIASNGALGGVFNDENGGPAQPRWL